MLKNVIQSCWANGGDPSTIIVGPKNKAVGSTFTGIATQYRENAGTKQATIIAGADVYVSDFGEHRIYPSRFNRDRSVLVLDMEYWGVAYLRPFQQTELARTGNSEKRQLLVEYAISKSTMQMKSLGPSPMARWTTASARAFERMETRTRSIAVKPVRKTGPGRDDGESAAVVEWFVDLTFLASSIADPGDSS